MKKSIAIILGLMLIFVTVLPAAAASTVTLQSISLSKTNVYLRVGQTLNLKVTLTPSNATENAITFASSSKTTVSVTNMGIMKALKTGTATITATSANKKVSAKCTVTVISASSKNTLIIGDKSSPGTLAPYNETSNDRAKATNYIYETLIYAETDGTFTPVLATGYTWKDPTHLVFKLRKNVKFSNGSEFKADDVLYTLQYAVKSATTAIWSSMDAANSKVIDDYTFELALKKTDVTVLNLLGIPSYFSILDKQTCEKDLGAMGSKPIGTGPYKLKSWIVGDTVTLEKNSSYWGVKPLVQVVILRKIAESAQRVIELQTGGVDFIYDTPATSIANLKSTGKYTIDQNPAYLVQNLYFNAGTTKTMANDNLRKAIAYAIDYDSIVKMAGNNSGAVPASFASRMASGSSILNPTGKLWWSYSAAKAKEYMTKAGYPNGITLNFLTNADNPFALAATEQLANNFKAVGINIVVKQMSLGPMIGYILNLDNPWDVVFFGNAEASVMMQSLRLDKTQCPFLNFKRDAQQSILDSMFTTTDAKKQNTAIKKLGVYFGENVPFVPFYEAEDIFAYTKNLSGVQYNGSLLNITNVYFK